MKQEERFRDRWGMKTWSREKHDGGDIVVGPENGGAIPNLRPLHPHRKGRRNMVLSQ